MVHRVLAPRLSNSFFLFGPRGTGKTTLLRNLFRQGGTLWLDLLDPAVEDRLARNPAALSQEIAAARPEWVVIDEVQKVPRLLDLVHSHIERRGPKFALTGSSARRLKRGAANLLAGRAYVNHLFPLTHTELGAGFSLDEALNWGTLPKVAGVADSAEKTEFLRSYALTYLKEEVWGEQLVRRLDPFRRFLEVAAEASGRIVNYSNIAQDVGADIKTVQSYFEILEDTLVAVILEPYHRSVRVRQRKSPKFYFFDTGVTRALNRQLAAPLLPGSAAYGDAFEQFLVLECMRLDSYRRLDYRFSYLRTKDGAEIDLVVERPGAPTALVEIKSADEVMERHVSGLRRLLPEFRGAEAFCLSRDPRRKKIGPVAALPWRDGLSELGLA